MNVAGRLAVFAGVLGTVFVTMFALGAAVSTPAPVQHPEDAPHGAITTEALG